MFLLWQIFQKNVIEKIIKNYFFLFVAQDKGSGIDYYLIKESAGFIFSKFSPWKKVDSPYILQDQNLQSYIYLKAVDRSGNTRLVFLKPSNPLPWY